MTEKNMTIREMCEAFDVTPRTLRFYEAKELIFPIREGQKRLFTRRDRARLKLILRGKRFGFSLEEIRQLLDLYSRDDAHLEQLTRTYDAAQQRLAQMERQRLELDEAIAELKDQMAWVGQMIDARKEATTGELTKGDANARLHGTDQGHAIRPARPPEGRRDRHSRL